MPLVGGLHRGGGALVYVGAVAAVGGVHQEPLVKPGVALSRHDLPGAGRQALPGSAVASSARAQLALIELERLSGALLGVGEELRHPRALHVREVLGVAVPLSPAALLEPLVDLLHAPAVVERLVEICAAEDESCLVGGVLDLLLALVVARTVAAVGADGRSVVGRLVGLGDLVGARPAGVLALARRELDVLGVLLGALVRSLVFVGRTTTGSAGGLGGGASRSLRRQIWRTSRSTPAFIVLGTAAASSLLLARLRADALLVLLLRSGVAGLDHPPVAVVAALEVADQRIAEHRLQRIAGAVRDQWVGQIGRRNRGLHDRWRDRMLDARRGDGAGHEADLSRNTPRLGRFDP